MDTGQKPTTTNNRSKVYLILSVVFLALMSLVWSLDDSLVYIFCGLAVYFLFLFYWTRPKAEDARFSGHSQADDLYENFKKTFGKERAAPRPKYKAPTAPHIDSKKVVKLAISAVFISFFSIVFFTIILSDDQPTGISFYDQAESFRLNGEFDSAKLYYRHALREDGQSAPTLVGYGNVLLNEELYDSAIKYFDWAVDADPYYDEARYNKALAFYYLKEYPKTRSEARELLEYSPDYSYANLLIGDSFYAEENYDSAIFWYDIGYSEGVRTAALSHVMGYIYDQRGDAEHAIQLYQEALYYDSTRTEIYDRLAEMIPEEAPAYRELSNRYRSN